VFTAPAVNCLRRLCLLLLLALTLLFLPCRAEAGRAVRVAIYQTKPLAYFDGDGSAHGLFVDTLNSVAEKEQWQVQYVAGSWQEGLDRLKKGTIDLVLCVGYTEERATYLDFPKEYLLLNWGVVYRPKGSHLTSLPELEGKRVTALKGDVYLAGFLELVRQFNIHIKLREVDQYTKVFKAVESGEAEAGVAGKLYGILNEDARGVEQTPVIFSPIKLGYAVAHGKNADLVAALDRHIAAMKADGASVYYQKTENLLGKKETWLLREAYWVVSGVAVVLLLAGTFIVLLKRQVKIKTNHLEAEIEQRKLTQEELWNEKAFLRSLIDAAADLIYFKDKNSVYLGCNQASANFTGVPEKDQIGMTDFDFFDRELAERVVAQDKKVLEGGVAVHNEEEVVTAAGRVLFDTMKAPIYGIDGRPLGLVGISRDITERRLAEDALLERENRFRSIFDYSPVAIGLGELAGGRLVEVNDAWLRLFGYRRDEVIGRSIEELSLYITARERDSINQIITEQGKVINHPVQLRRKNGSVIDIQYSADIITLDSNPYLQVIMTDITELKLAEVALRKSEYFFKESQKSAFIGSYLMDFTADAWESSEVLDAIFGIGVSYPRSAQGWLEIVHPDDREMMARYLKLDVIARHGAFAREYRIIRVNDHQTRWVYGLGTAEWDCSGEIVTLRGTIQDITERKHAEQEKQALEHQLLHAQKLESLGVLAGGIAHDFNNILAIIVGHCSLAQMDGPNAAQHFPEIEKAAERAAGLCRQMLAYAGKEKSVQKEVNVGEQIREMAAMLSATTSKNVTLRQHLAADLPPIMADPSQIRQVLMNLFINASEAIGQAQGEVNVTLAKRSLGAGEQVKDHLGNAIPSGSYLCLEVADNGCGMDEEVRRRVFEPFYTTKFTGRGLGMSAVLGIITAHRGGLQFFSEPGKGTTFRIYLPIGAGDGAAGQTVKPLAPTASWRGRGTILLVEDEVSLMLVARDMLRALGFSTVEACHGKEALELYEKHSADLALVVTDLGMPIMDGYALVAELKKLDRNLPVIISTGFGDGTVGERIAREDIAGMIGKPYNFDQLRDELKRVLGSS